jgi:hypothetical protein
MNRVLRIVAAVGLLALAALWAFGFTARFEPGAFLIFRIGSALALPYCLAAAVYLIGGNKKSLAKGSNKMNVAIDIADPAQIAAFPQHGWARNSHGIKLLWLPVLRLGSWAPTTRKENGIKDELSRGQLSEIKAFETTTKNLAVALRELQRCIRLGNVPGFDDANAERKEASRQAAELIPLFLDIAIVYVRRLADHFTRASRYALFRHAESAPRELKKLRELAIDDAKLRSLDPICDAGLLCSALCDNCSWLDKLRDSKDESGETVKGIRDRIEHHPAAITVRHYKEDSEPWQVLGVLGEPGLNKDLDLTLIQSLKDIIAGLAGFWTEVCRAAKLPKPERGHSAPYGDYVRLYGDVEDSTAFWPEIKGQ